MPYFTKGNAPTVSSDYLYYAFAVNLDNWGDDKVTMTRAYVDDVIHTHFEVGDIAHQALPNGWDYDGENYTAVPMGINEAPIYGLSKLETQSENGRTVYTATLGCYMDNGGFIPTAEEMDGIRENIAAGDLSALTLVRTEKVSYYISGETGEPVFLSHTLEDGSPEEIAAASYPVYDPDSFLTDDEMMTAGGVRLEMTYEQVLEILGTPDEEYETMDTVKSFVKDGYSYGFYQIDDTFPADYPLPRDGKYYLLNISAGTDCTTPLLRGIRIGDDIENVFDKFPTQDRELKQWAQQTVYGVQEAGQPRAVFGVYHGAGYLQNLRHHRNPIRSTSISTSKTKWRA
jgi:hypothetical protein